MSEFSELKKLIIEEGVYEDQRVQIISALEKLESANAEIEGGKALVQRMKESRRNLESENAKLRAALQQILDTPGLAGMDFTSDKKYRESCMKIIELIAREALKKEPADGK